LWCNEGVSAVPRELDPPHQQWSGILEEGIVLTLAVCHRPLNSFPVIVFVTIVGQWLW